ncbi:cryptococcal mannosyltransferase 1-domain-containing protein [Aspergillus cavernicola]|uniref:Cryptococcal mannosyltransferase 1-domain-containing protein n=1 Tax=Aspergillus cavernicola TaxID=176166 RepID=A0ABR4IIZ1_9EURO
MSAPLLPRHNRPEGRLSVESQEIYDLYENKIWSREQPPRARFIGQMSSLLQRFQIGYPSRRDYRLLIPALPLPPRYHRRLILRLSYYLLIVLSPVVVLVAFTSTFYPSYTRLPPHYSFLRDQVLDSNQAGRGNLRNEKIFIAASLYDPTGELTQGPWASSVLQLITLLGEENVFLSIYENDSGEEDRLALRNLDHRVPCNRSIVYEHLDPGELPKIAIPDGAERVKRITYLAETRNRALRPLDEATTRFNKLLYLNDVALDPIDALQLLFSTNADETGSRSTELRGYCMGLPFFPWFSDAGSGQSRRDVLSGKDAVSVRSCWGGMVAFDAQPFQSDAQTTAKAARGSLPARFRALNDTDLFWDASECCLIHADIESPRHGETETETGIYMNPFVRVAYDTHPLSWLLTTRRFEKLYFAIHNVGSHIVGLPWFNPRREEILGQSYRDTVFMPEMAAAGSFQTVERVGRHDGFCGRRGLQVVVPRNQGKKGWQTIPMPGR